MLGNSQFVGAPERWFASDRSVTSSHAKVDELLLSSGRYFVKGSSS